jgi:hypothetical protein
MCGADGGARGSAQLAAELQEEATKLQRIAEQRAKALRHGSGEPAPAACLRHMQAKSMLQQLSAQPAQQSCRGLLNRGAQAAVACANPGCRALCRLRPGLQTACSALACRAAVNSIMNTQSRMRTTLCANVGA